MRMISFILVMGAALASLKDEKWADFIQVFEQTFPRQLESSDLGKIFYDTIQVALQSREPLDRVFNLLRQQQVSIEEQQQRTDALHQKTSQKCKKDLVDAETHIAVLKKNQIDQQQDLDIKIPEQKKLQAHIELKKKDLTTAQQRLKEAEEKRQAQQKNVYKKLDEHQQAIEVITDVKRVFQTGLDYINENTHQPNAELPMEVLIQTQDALARAVELSDKFKYQEGYNALFTVLNGIHSKLGYVAQHKETVEAIVDMGADLANYASSTRDLVRKVDTIRENNFEKVTQQLKDEIQLAQNEIEQFQADLNQLETQLRIMRTDKAETDQKIDSKSKQRDDRQKECDTEDFIYGQKVQESQQQVDLITRIISITESNIKDLRQYVKLRSDPYYFDS